MANVFGRLGTANAYDNTLRNLLQRQKSLSDLQVNLSSGKRVVHASDDPTAAVEAERAETRISRIATEQRALAAQKNTVAMTESTLGDATSALQSFRDLLVSAGDASYSGTERLGIANQMKQLRDQILSYANRTDTNGLPLFGGLGSTSQPFVQTATGVTYNGIPGQQSSSEVAIPATADGQAAFMNVPTGNGVFVVTLGTNTVTPGPNLGNAYTDVGTVTNPTVAAAQGYDYTIGFSVAGGVTTYTTTNINNGATTSGNYVPGQAIQMGGISVVVKGTPADGDTLTTAPSATTGPGTGLFGAMDSAIAAMYSTGPNPNAGAGSLEASLQQGITRGLAEIDTAMDRLQSVRAQSGALLNRADTIDSEQSASNIQLESDRSQAEDLDMVKGISDFQNQQTGYSAALQTYAQVQRLSLFNYLG
jgi:flagellar hook-associated protein 3 FlgL